MDETKVTQKFQTTIPLRIRTFLGINAGEEVDWKIQGNRVVIGKKTRYDNPLELIKKIRVKTSKSTKELIKEAKEEMEKELSGE